MKIWADLSSIARLAAVCLMVGFILGLFVACSSPTRPAAPPGSPGQDRQAALTGRTVGPVG